MVHLSGVLQKEQLQTMDISSCSQPFMILAVDCLLRAAKLAVNSKMVVRYGISRFPCSETLTLGPKAREGSLKP